MNFPCFVLSCMNIYITKNFITYHNWRPWQHTLGVLFNNNNNFNRVHVLPHPAHQILSQMQKVQAVNQCYQQPATDNYAPAYQLDTTKPSWRGYKEDHKSGWCQPSPSHYWNLIQMLKKTWTQLSHHFNIVINLTCQKVYMPCITSPWSSISIILLRSYDSCNKISIIARP